MGRHPRWTVPTVVANKTNHSCQNPVLDTDNLYTVQPANNVNTTGSSLNRNPEWDGIIQVKTILADGSWSPPATPPYALPGCWTRNRVLSGLLPVYYSYKSLSSQYSAVVNVGDGDDVYDVNGSEFLIQPTVVRDPESSLHLIAFFRDKRAVFIYRSESADGGRTWSRPSPTSLPNNDSGIQATVLSSGNIALVYNPTRSGRDPLVVSLSPDLGLSWTFTRALENTTINATASNEYSYPSVFQAAGGSIHVSYTYLRQTIKYKILPGEEWIKKA
eukprot:TRINITY_DN8699_c0_g1_i1.p1 TRINITY_DN8699_c0_g1~~TRINITY_DN8699_c0_g1_i1.p1  ORF type:complete len:274 (+),score=33.56 TRINITY_DN8699_c0_g1_i1:734-1555(+)